MKNAVDILKDRGLLEAVTSDDVNAHLSLPVTVYAGFDPTSESLQVGNLLTIVTLAHFMMCGHTVVALAGGATGMIGDPSGKNSERSLLDEETVRLNLDGISENISRCLGAIEAPGSFRVVDNNEWLKDVTFTAFLRDVGRYFRVGAMLGKESVRARMESEAGMNFAEFSYQLLQAYDFLKLYELHNCTIQLGGSDQWGNITAGIDLVRKLRGAEVFGVTTPLVCDSAGRKFGKSEGNAVYLDPGKTSLYDFYQFFIRVDDADAVRLLKLYTFLPLDEIAGLESAMRDQPEKRDAQKRLASEVTRFVHGEEGLHAARKASEVMFGGSMEGLRLKDLLAVFADVPSADMEIQQIAGATAIDVAVGAGLCSSKGEARRLIENGGLYLNNNRVGDTQAKVSDTDIIEGSLLVLRSGKKNYRLVRIGRNAG